MNFYSEHKLPEYHRFLNKIWIVDNSTQQQAIPNLKILPNGCFNFALLIGKGALVSLKNKNYSFTQGIYLCSQFTEYVNVTLLETSKIILIQLPSWYFSYLKNDFSNFTDDILQSSSSTLFQQQIQLESPTILEELLAVVHQHFSNFETQHIHANFIETIAKTIIRNKGVGKISEVLKNYSYSERWLQSEFKKATGLTIKQFAKIIQFRDTVDKMTYEQPEDSLTSIGYEAGYNDQSHFVRNFKQFSNISPSKFIADDFVLSLK